MAAGMVVKLWMAAGMMNLRMGMVELRMAAGMRNDLRMGMVELWVASGTARSRDRENSLVVWNSREDHLCLRRRDGNGTTLCVRSWRRLFSQSSFGRADQTCSLLRAEE